MFVHSELSWGKMKHSSFVLSLLFHLYLLLSLSLVSALLYFFLSSTAQNQSQDFESDSDLHNPEAKLGDFDVMTAEAGSSSVRISQRDKAVIFMLPLVIIICFFAKEFFSCIGFAVSFVGLHAFLMQERGTVPEGYGIQSADEEILVKPGHRRKDDDASIMEKDDSELPETKESQSQFDLTQEEYDQI